MFTLQRLTVLCVLSLSVSSAFSQSISGARQGFGSKLNFNNSGVLGSTEVNIVPRFQYPVGDSCEHISGGGLWVGGKLDTAQAGTSAQLRIVATAYEGWAGPLYEFYPASSAADTIWKVNGRNVPRPVGWETYWGNSIRRTSFSDNDHYCIYTDYSRRITGHVPLNLKVIQSSFVWNDSYADAIHIFEYKLINMGQKQIDSAYVAMFMDGDVGRPIPNAIQNNYSAFSPSSRTAYIHNPVNVGSTPVGASILKTSRPLDSLRYAFRWYTGPQSPNTDVARYGLLSSGVIQPDEFPNLSDTRFLLSCGPFTLFPSGNPAHDTIIVAVAILSGQNVNDMLLRAARAKNIYLNGTLDVHRGDALPTRFELRQNYPNPFNPSTTISYELPNATHVRLTVHDVLGREVLTLVDGRKQAGIHRELFNASNLASGVYFYRLHAESVVETRKMILMQ